MAAAHKSYYSSTRMHAALAVAVLALLSVTVWMLVADERRAWKEHQREYRALRGLRPKTPAIEQIWLPDLPVSETLHAIRRDRCTTCHQGIGDAGSAGLRQPYAAHPRLDLFLGEKSPHPMCDFGCTVCHDGQGSATDFRWASHTPNDPAQARQWRDRWGWSANPHWDTPMVARPFNQSRCIACHREIVDLEASGRFADSAGELLAGYQLVRQYGCFGCHEIPPFAGVAGAGRVPQKVGPNLRNAGGKFDREYLIGRLREPAKLLPSTRMPRLFGLDEHLSGHVKNQTRTAEEEEIRAVADYLLASAQGMPSPQVSASASADRGKRLFQTTGCMACHRHRDFPAITATHGMDLSNVGSKYREGGGRAWLVGWICDPARYAPQTLMPKLLQDGDAADAATDLATYLITERGSPGVRSPGISATNAPTIAAAFVSHDSPSHTSARRVIERRGCAGCHDIPGIEDARPIGPSLRGWGRKAEQLLAFERVGESVAREIVGTPPPVHHHADDFFLDALLTHRREGFLWQKLRSPRSFDYGLAETKPVDEQLRMGQFAISDAQRQSIATFILALTEPAPTKYVYQTSGQRAAIVEGRKVLDKYGCAGCHTLELERWTIAADSSRAGRFSAQPESVELSGMPRLDAAGALQEEDEEDGTRYFFTLWAPAVIDGQRHSVGDADVVVPNARRTLVRRAQGGDLARQLYPVLLADARRSGASGAEVEAWGWLPPPLVHEGAKVEPQWLFRFLLDPQAIRPAVAMRMPRFNLSTAEARKLTDCFAA
ncbi:MAG: cytochrome c, partial [Planctomycetaceae bacterium]|nr:cytochrome c [Planctomycetaceae bacterium]